MESLHAGSAETWMPEWQAHRHLILLSGNMVEGYVIEELCQLLDVGLVGYQLMILSLPFSFQLVNYQGSVSIYFELFDLEVDCCLDPKGARLILGRVVLAVKAQSSREGYALIILSKQNRPYFVA